MLPVETKRPIVNPIAWRFFWVVLLCAHAPALFSSWKWLWTEDGTSQWLRGVLLTLTQVLFLLKILDVAWLRLPNQRRIWIAMSIAVALLHAGVMQRTIAHQTNGATDIWMVVLTGGLTLVGAMALRRIVRTIEWIRSCRLRSQTRMMVRLALGRVFELFTPPRYLLLARACRVNRAPPRS